MCILYGTVELWANTSSQTQDLNAYFYTPEKACKGTCWNPHHAPPFLDIADKLFGGDSMIRVGKNKRVNVHISMDFFLVNTRDMFVNPSILGNLLLRIGSLIGTGTTKGLLTVSPELAQLCKEFYTICKESSSAQLELKNARKEAGIKEEDEQFYLSGVDEEEGYPSPIPMMKEEDGDNTPMRKGEGWGFFMKRHRV